MNIMSSILFLIGIYLVCKNHGDKNEHKDLDTTSGIVCLVCSIILMAAST